MRKQAPLRNRIAALLMALPLLCAACGHDGAPVTTDQVIDPSQPVSPTVDFSASVPQDETADAAFSVSADDFISAFNAAYGEEYLKPLSSDGWTCLPERSPCFGFDAVRYRYSEDTAVWPMPTISVYAPENGTKLYEIRLTFDDHGYQQALLEKYRALCLCAETMVLPQLNDAEAAELFDTLYAQAESNYYGDHELFGDPERPLLPAVIRYGSIGFYGFYGSGNIEICILPLTPSAVEALQAAGTAIQNAIE